MNSYKGILPKGFLIYKIKENIRINNKSKAMKNILVIILLCMSSLGVSAQARLTIENNSQRQMTVKIMKGFGNGSLHELVSISSYESKTIYFSQSGYYFTKTKAVLRGKDPVYQKGQPFKVTNDDTGYSVMTLTGHKTLV